MLCNKINRRMCLLWHWCQRGRKESSSKYFGNRFETDWMNTEESLNGRMQRRVEVWTLNASVAINAKGGDGKYWTSNEYVLMVVVINGNSGDGRIRRIKPLGDSDVKTQGEQNWRKRAHQELTEKKEDKDPVTVGFHSNFPKGRQPSDLQKLRGR